MMRTTKIRFSLALLAASVFALWAIAQQAPGGPPDGPAGASGGRGGRGGRGGSGGGRGFSGGRGGGRAARTQKVVLAWADTRNGVAQHDSVSHALALVERLGYESGMWKTFIRTDSNIISYNAKMTTGGAASGGPNLGNVDAIFFMGHREVPIDEGQKAELLKFVHDDGKGFVAAHVALTALMDWPEFGEMLGGTFDQHPYGSVMGTVINEDPNFPATKHLPPTFDIRDEFYQVAGFSREKSHVLLRLDTSKLPPNSGVHSKDGDFPLAWAKMYGKGRVFYGSFAHDDKTWDDPDVSRMYFEAIRWALGMTDADVSGKPYPGTPANVNAAPAR